MTFASSAWDWVSAEPYLQPYLYIYGVNLKAIWAFVGERYVELTVELWLSVRKTDPIKWANSTLKCLVYRRHPVARFIIQQWNRLSTWCVERSDHSYIEMAQKCERRVRKMRTSNSEFSCKMKQTRCRKKGTEERKLKLKRTGGCYNNQPVRRRSG
jgi:hypothetical protein